MSEKGQCMNDKGVTTEQRKLEFVPIWSLKEEEGSQRSR